MEIEGISRDLIERIRVHIIRTKKNNELLKSRKKWSRLTSSLYVLEDSAAAVKYYCDTDFPAETNGKYLFIYGILQSLILQQDAIDGISCALLDEKIDFKKEYPDAGAVRDIRNDVAGHPTDRSNGKEYIYLIQGSLQKKYLTYIKKSIIEENSSSVTVDIQKAINDTTRCVNDVLNKVVKNLDEEYRAYREAHRDIKMKDIFSQLQYAREKVLLKDISAQQAEYDLTKLMVAECEEELIKRYGSVKAQDHFASTIAKIKVAYNLIDAEFQIEPKALQEEGKQLVLEYLFDRLQELENLCADSDEEFEEL